jgi:hypothetical protein
VIIEPGSLVAVARLDVQESAEWAMKAAAVAGGGEVLAASMLTAVTLYVLEGSERAMNDE